MEGVGVVSIVGAIAFAVLCWRLRELIRCANEDTPDEVGKYLDHS